MYYCTKITEMMKLSKETNKSVVSTVNEETIFVKYYEQFDDYTFKYSWIITENDSRIQKGIYSNVYGILLSKFGYNQSISETDVVQIGLISVYNTSGSHFSDMIELAKSNKLVQTRDTKYVFCGKKIISVVQYFGSFSNPFDCMNVIDKWNDPNVESYIQNQKFTQIIKGIHCTYSEEKDSAIFSIGCKHKRTVFVHNITKDIPEFVCIDSMRGITEFIITDNIK